MKKIMCLFLSMLLFLPTFAQAEDVNVLDLVIQEDAEGIFERFSEDVKKQVPLDALQQVFSSLPQMLGAYQGGTVAQKEISPSVLQEEVLEYQKASLKVTYMVNEKGEITTLFFAPVPKKQKVQEKENVPLNVVEKELVIDEKGQYPLYGTLCYPKEGENLPLVLLVHGSGPNDRDETVQNTKMFKDIAHFLASKGIAVMRYDKRTYTHGKEIAQSKDFASFTVYDETIDDVIKVAEHLKTLPFLNKERFVLVGHSMGGMLSPKICQMSENLFCKQVLLSSTPYTLFKLMYDQNMALIQTLPQAQQEANIASVQSEYEKVQALPLLSEAEQKQTTVFGMNGYYAQSLLMDTVQILKDTHMPVLVINGTEDFQVVNQNGYDAFYSHFKDQKNITLVKAEALNHLLMHYNGDKQFQYTVNEYAAPNTVDENILQTITNFVLE